MTKAAASGTFRKCEPLSVARCLDSQEKLKEKNNIFLIVVFFLTRSGTENDVVLHQLLANEVRLDAVFRNDDLINVAGDVAAGETQFQSNRLPNISNLNPELKQRPKTSP